MSTVEEFSKILEHFLGLKDVKKQGNSLKIHRKMFAMMSKNNFVVKLPKERVTELIASGHGLPFDPGTGTHMKEWVIIPLDYKENWMNITQEAKEFAVKLSKK